MGCKIVEYKKWREGKQNENDKIFKLYKQNTKQKRIAKRERDETKITETTWLWKKEKIIHYEIGMK